MCAKFQQKILKSMVIGARQRIEIEWILHNLISTTKL